MSNSQRGALPALLIALVFSAAPAFSSPQEFGATIEDFQELEVPSQEKGVYSPFAGRNYPDQVLFGDMHFHTELSFDAGLIGNLARFANHSCDPNMVMQKWNVLGEWRVGLFALKPVAAGEEMTWNYDLESFEGHANMKCNCGALNCSGFLGVKPEIRAPEQKPKAAPPPFPHRATLLL